MVLTPEASHSASMPTVLDVGALPPQETWVELFNDVLYPDLTVPGGETRMH
jgi:hypothetical protein